MIDFEDALQLALSECSQLPIKEIPITEAAGRILAVDIAASIDLPQYSKATVDGYAIYSEDAKDKKAIHEVIGAIPAGCFVEKRLERGQTMQIQAEAPLPLGSDTVVPMNEIRLLMNGSRVGMLDRVRKGKNVVNAGDLLKKGDEIIKAGKCLNPVDLGLLSSVGYARVQVFMPPRVGILSIGNEFVEVGKKIKPGQVWDANGIQLLTALYEMKVQPEYLGTLAENEEAIITTVNQALSCHVIIMPGMAGAGRKQLLMNAFEKTGTKILFDGMSLIPSGAMTLAKLKNTLIFVLPLNPLFCIILYEIFITPVLRKIMGYQKIFLSAADAILNKKIRKTQEYHLIYPGILYADKNRYFVTPCESLNKLDIFSYSKCNCLLSLAKNVKSIKSGKEVQVFLTKQMGEVLRMNEK